MSRPMVVGLGELLWDVYPDGRYVGGATANVAVHAHRLGATGIVASAVGEDGEGDAIIETLRGWGMDTSFIQRCATHPTGSVRVALDERGVPSFECSWDTAFDYLEYDGRLHTLSSKADGVVVGTFDQRNSVGRDTTQRFLAEAEDVVKVFDVNFRWWDEQMEEIVQLTLEHTDILKFAEDEMRRMRDAFGQENRGTISFMRWMSEAFRLKLVALSLGQKGCVLTDGKDTVRSPGVRVSVEDTTGCGDAFVAGLMVKVLEGASMEETAELCNTLGAFVATKKGATPAYADADIQAFRETHSERVPLGL